MKAGGVTDIQRGDSPQHIQNGVSAESQECRQQQDHDAVIARTPETHSHALAHPPPARRCLLPDRFLLLPRPPSASPPPLSKGLLPRRGTSLSTAVLLALGGTPSLPCVYTGHASLL